MPNQDRLIFKNLEIANPSKLEIPEKLIPRPEQPIATSSDPKPIVNTVKEKILEDRAAESQIPKIKKSQDDSGLSKIKKSEKYKNPRDKITLTNKDAKKTNRKLPSKNLNRVLTEYN